MSKVTVPPFLGTIYIFNVASRGWIKGTLLIVTVISKGPVLEMITDLVTRLFIVTSSNTTLVTLIEGSGPETKLPGCRFRQGAHEEQSGGEVVINKM